MTKNKKWQIIVQWRAKIILLNNFCNLLFMYFCTYKSTKKRWGGRALLATVGCCARLSPSPRPLPLTYGFSIVLIALLCKPLLEERCPKGGVVFASLPYQGRCRHQATEGFMAEIFIIETPQSLRDSSPKRGAVKPAKRLLPKAKVSRGGLL